MLNDDDFENENKKLNNIIKDLQGKLIILKNALLEERKKSNRFENKIKDLNEQIYEKDGIILNYKTENKTLDETISKSNLKEYYKKFLEDELNDNDDSDIDIDFYNQLNQNNNPEVLKEENRILNKKLTKYQKENQILKGKFELITNDIENIKKESNLTIEKLKKELEEIKRKNKEEKERYEIIEGLSKEFNSGKKLYEDKILELQKSNKKLKEQKDNLQNVNNELILLNKVYSITMTELKNKIEEMGNENLKIKKKIDESIEININYLFIGSIFHNDKEINRKQIMIFFGKFQDKIELTFENGIFDIPIQKVISIKKVKDREGYLSIRIYQEEKEKKIICQFKERESEFILQFYHNMKKNFEDNKEQVRLMNYNFDNFSF